MLFDDFLLEYWTDKSQKTNVIVVINFVIWVYSDIFSPFVPLIRSTVHHQQNLQKTKPDGLKCDKRKNEKQDCLIYQKTVRICEYSITL